MSNTSPAKRELVSSIRTVSPPPQRRKVHVSKPANHVEVETPLESATRFVKIVSWNVNGVGPFFQRRLDAANVSSLRMQLKKHGWPQLLCLQEVKINSTDTATQRRLQHAANAGSHAGEPTYGIEYSLPRDPHNARGFGGKVHGVASLIRRDFLPFLTTTRRPDWELEGRLLVHETAFRLVIINGYWLNGTSAPWNNANGKPEGTRHDLKLRYHDRILNEVLAYQNQGHHVLLVGDMNVALDKRDGHPNLRTVPFQHVKNRDDFNRKFFSDEQGMQGVDTFRHFHGDSRKYTYYSSHREWGKSCDRVDHIIASRSLSKISAIVNCDICNTPEDAAHSDHVPIWTTIDASKLDEHCEAIAENPGARKLDGASRDTAVPRDG